MKIESCPHCGHPIPDAGVYGVLSPKRRRMVELLATAGSRGLSSYEIMDLLYQDDPNGGAEHRSTISVMRAHINPLIEPFGLRIVGRLGAGGNYRLEALPCK